MTSPMISEALMREQQRQVAANTARAGQAGRLGCGRRAPLRMGAGRLLVRAGLRLAQVDPSSAPLPKLAAS